MHGKLQYQVRSRENAPRAGRKRLRAAATDGTVMSRSATHLAFKWWREFGVLGLAVIVVSSCGDVVMCTKTMYFSERTSARAAPSLIY